MKSTSSSSSRDNSNLNDIRDDAIEDLVVSMVGHAHSESLDFARQIADSTLGAPYRHRSGIGLGGTGEFSAIWKHRIQSHFGVEDQNNKSRLRTAERRFAQLTKRCRENNESERLPSDIMTVLTQLIHHQDKKQSKTTPLQPRRAVETAQEQQQHQPRNNDAVEETTSMLLEMNPATATFVKAMQLEEEELLRELLFALQGIDGERISFSKYKPHDENTNITALPYRDGIQLRSAALHSRLIAQSQSNLLGSGAVDAFRLCAEAGWLYRRVQSYVRAIQDNQEDTFIPNPTYPSQRSSSTNNNAPQTVRVGVVPRAFARSLAQELQNYHQLIGEWESRDWSLRQLLVETRLPIYRLKILATLTDALGHLSGGHLLTALFLHANHGDSRQSTLVQSLLYEASQPWYQILYLWTTQGILADPFGEFFVSEAKDDLPSNDYDSYNANTNNNSNQDKVNMWHERYHINEDQIPTIMDPGLVEQAFVVGKGINFIRECLMDSEWTLSLLLEQQADKHNIPIETSIQQRMRLGYQYTSNQPMPHQQPPPRRSDIMAESVLSKTLQKVEEKVHSHILKSLMEDHSMLDHLFALKQFLFHGQGDFFSALMDGLHDEFGSGGSTSQGLAGVYKHTLYGIMETAFRRTNAKDLPTFCLERVSVELLIHDDDSQYSFLGHLGSYPKEDMTFASTANSAATPTTQTEDDLRTVWDIFMLDYTVPDPLIAIVHSNAMIMYKKVFAFLFGLKKVERLLNLTWRQSASLQHALQTSAQYNQIDVSTNPEYSQAVVLLRKISITRQAMMHFVINLKSYVMFEVLEGGWKTLVRNLEAARTLDEAIQAHDHYLEGICRKSLLGVEQTGESGSNGGISSLIRAILSIAAEFCYYQERLFDEALLAADRVAQRRWEAEKRAKSGHWGFQNETDLAEEESCFGLSHTAKLMEAVRLSEHFNQRMQTLLKAMDDYVHGGSGNGDLASIENKRFLSPTTTTLSSPRWNNMHHETAWNIVFGAEQDDIDSLRFLMLQLDHNGYYGLLPKGGGSAGAGNNVTNASLVSASMASIAESAVE